MDNNKGIKGERIDLHSIKKKDFDRIFEWKNDFELAEKIKSHKFPIAEFEVEEWFKRNQSDKNQVLLGIYEKEDDKIIGVVRLMFIDWISSTAELGIFIGESNLKGKGYGRETMNLLLDYAFNSLNLRRIHLKVLESNEKAINLYKSLNFVEEGMLRKHFFINNTYENIMIMGILKDEFK